jgi:Ca2+-binding RTX toxin-like protein
VVGTGDFDGDGKADILWRNTASGATVVWTMSGPHNLGGGYTDGFADTGWVLRQQDADQAPTSVSYLDSSAAVLVNLLDPALNTGDAAGGSFLYVHGVEGSNFNDTITGDRAGDVLHGADGNDSIAGGSAADTLDGGAGSDTISGGAGDDLIVGGAGRDAMFGGAGHDTFSFAAHSSSYALGSQDLIWDWEAGDKLQFGAPGTVVNYTEYGGPQVTDYASALDFVSNMTTGFTSLKYVALQVGADVVVFSDAAPDFSAVVLIGRSLADVDSSNII